MLLLLALMSATALYAQQRKVQNRPYLDQRRLHYGFLFGFHMQDLELRNNGEQPAEPIRESGGLGSLRTLVEKEGGSMKISVYPDFILSIFFPNENSQAEN